MKNIRKIALFLILLLISIVVAPTFSNATIHGVSDAQELVEAIEDAVSGDTIELSSNITLTRPLGVTGKQITINGNGHTITREASNWEPDGANGSLITAGLSGTKLTLKNLTLTNSQKYGVQSYDGAYVVLDDVTISGCGYGAVLVNAGTIEVRSLHLTRNGSSSNNGIEIARGDGLYTSENDPKVIMNGTLTSTEDENVIYVAIEDEVANFEIENTETSENKLFISGNKVVVTDNENNILFSSNDIGDIDVEGTPYVETPQNDQQITEPEPTIPEEPTQDDTPKTGLESNLSIAIYLIILSAIAIIALKEKNL